ncbi:hypothetical protein DAI22_09g010133 [Oryza sativa Japonica Group]|nr:hypothetical protein DAI22_09g010133 [Oryza sativa Japonica Group]
MCRARCPKPLPSTAATTAASPCPVSSPRAISISTGEHRSEKHNQHLNSGLVRHQGIIIPRDRTLLRIRSRREKWRPPIAPSLCPSSLSLSLAHPTPPPPPPPYPYAVPSRLHHSSRPPHAAASAHASSPSLGRSLRISPPQPLDPRRRSPLPRSLPPLSSPASLALAIQPPTPLLPPLRRARHASTAGAPIATLRYSAVLGIEAAVLVGTARDSTSSPIPPSSTGAPSLARCNYINANKCKLQVIR